MKRIAALLLVAVLPLAAGAADPALEEALRYHEYRDYDTAFELFQELAEAGNAAAQANVGYYYDNGLGVEQDTAEAVHWYRLAAENGDPTAQYNLGVMYEVGEGVERDYTEAFKWFRLAADSGDTAACIYVGLFFEEGLGRTRDPVAAYKWYHVAAERKDMSAVMKRKEIAPELSPEEIRQATAEAEIILEDLRRRHPMPKPELPPFGV